MAKSITLLDAAYIALLREKGKDMPFSDMVPKLIETSKRRSNFSKYTGALKPDSINMEKFKKHIEGDRAKNIDRV